MNGNEFGKYSWHQVLTQGDIAVMILALEIRLQGLKWWQWYERQKIGRSLEWLEALNEWIAYGKKTYQVKLVIDRGVGQ